MNIYFTPMSLVISCPNCGLPTLVTVKHQSKTVLCPICQSINFVIVRSIHTGAAMVKFEKVLQNITFTGFNGRK